MWILLVAALLLSFAGTYFVVSAYMLARMTVGKVAREEMFWCHRHGMFRKKHCLWLDVGGVPMTNATGTIPKDATAFCPVCWKERWESAKQEAYK